MKKGRNKIITLGILISFATGIIYFINRLIFASATLKNLLKSSANNYYNWRFGKIYYKKTGSGSPILLIHDLTVYSSAYEWKEVIDKLSQSHTVYAILQIHRHFQPDIWIRQSDELCCLIHTCACRSCQDKQCFHSPV